MYNDYYLQQIDNKLNITNTKLEDIIENQEAIMVNQQTLISGDNQIIKNQKEQLQGLFTISIAIMLLILYHFIERCLK